jgi:hypothetical protein
MKKSQHHVERYYNLYYERNPQALATEIFTLPWIVMNGNGQTVCTTEGETRGSSEIDRADIEVDFLASCQDRTF